MGTNPIYKKFIKYGYILSVIPIFFITRYYYDFNPENSLGSSFFPSCPGPIQSVHLSIKKWSNMVSRTYSHSKDLAVIDFFHMKWMGWIKM